MGRDCPEGIIPLATVMHTASVHTNRVPQFGAIEGSHLHICRQLMGLIRMAVDILQVVKIVVPVYYGSRYQCERVPKHAVLGFIKRYRAQMDASSAALAAASQKGQLES